jgi:UDP-glucose 4-epimerase
MPIVYKNNSMSFYSNKKILITGGLGFIGSSLAKQLVVFGSKVTLVDSLIPKYGGNLFNIHELKDRVTINVCDVRDPFAMAYLVKGKDIIFNLAGQTSHIDSMINPKTDLDINITAQLSILEACRKYNSNVKIVFASTRQLYGRPKYLPVDELHPTKPVDVNGINKLAGEGYHILYNDVYGLRTCVLRLTNTYGPGMRIKDANQTFLGIWIRNLLEGKTIKVFGDGKQLRDFNYIDDCVTAMLLAGVNELANGKIYNLGSNEVINLKDLAKELVSLVDVGSYEIVPFPEDRKAIDIGDYYSDYTRIEQDLSWKPSVDLQQGLRNTINYYAKYLNSYI